MLSYHFVPLSLSHHIPVNTFVVQMAPMNRLPVRRIAVQCCIALVLFRLGNLEEDFLGNFSLCSVYELQACLDCLSSY